MLESFGELLAAETEMEWSATLFRLGESLGFRQVLFALVPMPGQALEEAFLRSNYSGEWRRTYERGRLHRIDPTVIHCISHNIPLIWSPEIFTTHPQRELYEEARAYGIRSGVTLPIHGPQGQLGILCCVNDAAPTHRNRRDLLRHLPTLSLLRDFAFESSARHSAAYGSAQPRFALTHRERECLRWAAHDKTSWEIARILLCSEATVNFHIKNVCRKFDVSSRRAAIVKALHLNLIRL